MAYLRNSYPTVAFKSSTQKKGKISQKDSKFSKATSADLQGSESLGTFPYTKTKEFARSEGGGGMDTVILSPSLPLPSSLSHVRKSKSHF